MTPRSPLPAVERYLAPPSFEAQIWAWPITTLNPIRTEMYMFTMEQVLPGRGKRTARELVGGRDADVARREITVEANAILDQVRQSFAALALARETLVIYDRQVPVLRDLAEAATVRYASGHGEQHDTVTPLIALTRLQSSVITWRTRARTEEARLNALLGRDVDLPVEPLLPLIVTAVPFDAETAALERHPAMALATAEIAREEAELARLQGERRPDFVVGGGYMLTPGDAGAWIAKAGVTWPNAPWSRRRLDAEIEVQALRVSAATARRDAVASGIRRGVSRGAGPDCRRARARRTDLVDAAAARRACPGSLAGGLQLGPGGVRRRRRVAADGAGNGGGVRGSAVGCRAGAGRAGSRDGVGSRRDGPPGRRSAAMSRRAPVAVAVVAVVVAAAAYFLWAGGGARIASIWRGSERAALPAPTTGTAPPAPAPIGPQAPPRVPVTLDVRRQQLIGVRTSRAERVMVAPEVRAIGTVRADETRQTEVNVRADGWIRDLRADFTGRPVRQGETLFALYSPDLIATQNEYLLAVRGQTQAIAGQVPELREYSARLVEAARERLRRWDMGEAEIQELEQRAAAFETIPVRSPASGVIVEKAAIEGMHVTPGQTLFRIADLSVVWVEADVYERDMAAVRIGQSATVTLDAYPDQRFTGRATYVHPFVEEQTRTMKVRFQLPNPRGLLKPGMYANVQLITSASSALAVPADAVLDSGSEQVVFVALGEGYFEPRRVRTGRRVDTRVEITEGLKEGDDVATGATFFLDSESQLQAAVRGSDAAAGAMPRAGAGQELDITFRPQPDPPRAGETALEVSVRDAAGAPVTDADVSVTFFMAAMPTMNMPAMRNETKLQHASEGMYRGRGQVMSAGRWDVTVTVMRGGQRLGSRQLSMVAR